MDCANMNFDNTIFSFTRIMWLSNPTKHLAALVADWPSRAILTEFVKTCSVVFEGHFEFFVQVFSRLFAISVHKFAKCEPKEHLNTAQDPFRIPQVAIGPHHDHCLPTTSRHGLLFVQSEVLRNTPAGDKEKVSKAMHRVMEHNQLFYCTNNEIVVGEMAKTNMDPIHAEVCGAADFIFI